MVLLSLRIRHLGVGSSRPKLYVVVVNLGGHRLSGAPGRLLSLTGTLTVLPFAIWTLSVSLS